MSKENVEEFLQSLAVEVAQKVAHFIYEHHDETPRYLENRSYRVDFLEARADSMMLDFMQKTRPESMKDILPSMVKRECQMQEEKVGTDSEYAHTITPCWKCGKEYRRKDLHSGYAYHDPWPLSSQFGYDASYVCLCPECEKEYLYECQGLTCICVFCNERYNPRTHSLKREERLHSPVYGVVCKDCLSNHSINKLNDEEKRLKIQLSRAAKEGTEATLTYRQWLQTLAHFNHKCAYCQNTYTCMEHFVPISLQGGTTVHNCIPACSSCNATKHDNHPDTLDKLFPSGNLARIRSYLASGAERKE